MTLKPILFPLYYAVPQTIQLLFIKIEEKMLLSMAQIWYQRREFCPGYKFPEKHSSVQFSLLIPQSIWWLHGYWRRYHKSDTWENAPNRGETKNYQEKEKVLVEITLHRRPTFPLLCPSFTPPIAYFLILYFFPSSSACSDPAYLPVTSAQKVKYW